MNVHLDIPSPSHLHCRINFFCRFDFFLSLKSWCRAWSHLTDPKPLNRTKNTFGVISRFDPNATSLWWRTRTSKSVHSSWSWTPSSLVISYFFKLSHFDDLVTSRPRFWWRTWNRLWMFLRNWRYFYLRMVFNSWRWTLSLVARSNSLIAS